MTPWIAELFGTMLLVLLGNGVVANVVLKDTKGSDAGWIVITAGWGMAVFIAVLCTAEYSGAHINPAVTVGLVMAGVFPAEDMPAYVAAQMAGAMIGAALVYLCYRQHFVATEDRATKLATFSTAPNIRSLPTNFLCEVVGTFVLVFAALSMSGGTYHAFSDPEIAGEVGLGSVGALPIGLVVWGIGMCLGGTTGYAINPARDLGPGSCTSSCRSPARATATGGTHGSPSPAPWSVGCWPLGSTVPWFGVEAFSSSSRGDSELMASPRPSNEPVESVSLGFVVLISGAAALGGFLFGFDTAVINGAVLAIEQEFEATTWQIGLSVSMALLGSAAGALFAGRLADRFGRIAVMLTASVLFTASAIGSGFAFGIIDLVVWRVVGGVGVGAASVIAPAYIAEVAPARLRGRLGSLQQLAIVVGIFVALLNNYLIVSASGSASAAFWLEVEAWRWMFWWETPVAVLYGVLALIIPESPRYLVAAGRESEATAVLRRILGAGAEAKVAEIRGTLELERRPRLADLRGRFGLLAIVWLGVGLSVFQQFVGINVIFYYGSALWQVVGFDEGDAFVITVITGITNIVTTLVAIACIDRFGRKPLLLVGSAGMFLALGVMAWIFGTAPVGPEGLPQLAGAEGRVALVAANVFIFFFGFSWGPVVWVLLGEMFNNRIRAAALSVSAMAQWIANFAVSTTFPPMVTGLGVGVAYGLYSFSAALSFLFVLFLIRETRGKELEEME